MGLSNFFRINMPYGIRRNSNNEWTLFNREYQPLGYNTKERGDSVYYDTFLSDLPVNTKYKGLTENVIRKNFDEKLIHENKDGTLRLAYFYDDGTDPSRRDAEPIHWKNYFRLIKFLSKYFVDKSNC